MTDRPYAFLSSITRLSAGLDDLPIRERLYHLGKDVGRPVWVAEKSKPDMSPETWDPLDIADTCIEQVRAADIFILLLHGRFGSAISVKQTATRSSFVEIELFEALLSRKPIYVFKAKSFAPDPDLERLLKIFTPVIPEISSGEPLSDEQIVAAVKRTLRSVPVARRWGLRLPGLRPASLVDQAVGRLALARGTGAPIRFLDGQFGTETSAGISRKPDKEFIASLLAVGDQDINQQRKLARLWLAARELETAPFTESANRDFLPLWHTLFGRWSSAAAWYGLHGHLYLGMAASLHSQHEICERAVVTGLTGLALPYGPLASAYYSMAKQMPTRRLRREYYTRALGYVNQAMGQGATAGQYAIRGSIHLALGDGAEAIADYQEQSRLLATEGAGDGRRGEALSEMGYAMLRVGWSSLRRRRDAVRRMEEGVHLMEAVGQSGFLVRGKAKLAIGLMTTGRLDEADRQIERAAQIAENQRMHDQLTRIHQVRRVLRVLRLFGRRPAP